MGIVRVGLQAGRQTLHHFVDFFGCHASRGGWVHRWQFVRRGRARISACKGRQACLGAGVGNFSGHLLGIGRARLQHGQKLLPLRGSACKVRLAVGDDAGHHQAHRVLRVKRQRLVQQLLWLAFNNTTSFGGQQVGVVHQQVGIGVDQFPGVDEGLLCFRQTAQHLVGARQHGPAFGVVGFGFEIGRQGLHHFQNLLAADLLRGLGIDGIGCAQPDIHADGAQGEQQSNKRRHAPWCPDTAGHSGGFGGRLGGVVGIVQQAQLQFVTGGLIVGGADGTPFKVTLQRLKLLAVDVGIQALA